MAEAEPSGEMNEAMLLIVSEIFWPTGDWETQKRFYYDETKYDTYLEQLGVKYPVIKKDN